MKNLRQQLQDLRARKTRVRELFNQPAEPISWETTEGANPLEHLEAFAKHMEKCEYSMVHPLRFVTHPIYWDRFVKHAKENGIDCTQENFMYWMYRILP